MELGFYQNESNKN